MICGLMIVSVLKATLASLASKRYSKKQNIFLKKQHFIFKKLAKCSFEKVVTIQVYVLFCFESPHNFTW